MPKGDDAGHMWGFQLWANLPAAHKMMHPRYQEVTSQQIPVISTGNGGTIRVICGEVKGTKGPVQDIVTDPEYLMNSREELQIAFDEYRNGTFLKHQKT